MADDVSNASTRKIVLDVGDKDCTSAQRHTSVMHGETESFTGLLPAVDMVTRTVLKGSGSTYVKGSSDSLPTFPLLPLGLVYGTLTLDVTTLFQVRYLSVSTYLSNLCGLCCPVFRAFQIQPTCLEK